MNGCGLGALEISDRHGILFFARIVEWSFVFITLKLRTFLQAIQWSERMVLEQCTHVLLKYEESPSINSPCRYLNSEGYEGGFERMEVEKLLTDIESDFQSWAQSFVPLVIGVNDPISIEKLKRSFLQMRPDIALSVAEMIFLSDLRDVLEEVEVPCTIIQATDDIVVPISVARYMQHKMKGKPMVEITGSQGHFPQLTAHQMLIEALDRVFAAMELYKDGKVSNEEYAVNSGVLG